MSQMLEVQAVLYWFSPKLSVCAQDQVSDCFDSFLVCHAARIQGTMFCFHGFMFCPEHPVNVPDGILSRCVMGSATTQDSVIHCVQPSLGEEI